MQATWHMVLVEKTGDFVSELAKIELYRSNLLENNSTALFVIPNL